MGNSPDTTTTATEAEGGSFADLFEQSIRVADVGSVVDGKVIAVSKDFVLVDIGDKAEGEIDISEFKNEEGHIEIKIGDRFEVFVEKREPDGGIKLSREQAIGIKVWEKIARIHEANDTINGRIDSRVKGGLSVDIGVPAFLPYSQIDLRPVRDLDALIGASFDFKILKYNRRRNNVVISRRAIMEEAREKLRSEMRSTLEEGQILTGSVTNITDYGVFIDLGGMDGLCHITDLSWGRISHPSKIFKVGDEIQVKILKYDKEHDKVSLGVKQLKSDPWETIQQRYPVGAKIPGKVVSLTDYGAFVELEEGVEGLVHISEMSWSKKSRHPSKIVAVGDQVEVAVLNVDPTAKRISLGMKQLQPNPWDMVAGNYPVGSIIEGKIKNITDFGIFIGIEEGIDGLIHVSDFSWTERIKHPGEKHVKGEIIQAVVLKIDKENERFSLGIKQLQPDPWRAVAEKYAVGTKISGRITNVTDFGVFVELEKGIEGLIHISELNKEKTETLVGLYNIGDTIEARVINVSALDRKIGLSLKAPNDASRATKIEEYQQKQATSGPSTLGDLLKGQVEGRDKPE